MMITAYPVAGKQKSQDICQAFIRGCGGQIGTLLREGAAVFYGVDASNMHIWRQVIAEGRDYYYIDNAYFDSLRGSYFRITKNALQHSGIGTSNGRRFDSMMIDIKPWMEGRHIVFCEQSESFMRDIVQEPTWLEDRLAAMSDHPLRFRAWNRDKALQCSTLREDLKEASLLVTHSSAAAVTAALEGVPVLVSKFSAAHVVNRNTDRRQWASVLADHQFTLAEMRSGYAWSVLNG